MGNRQVINSEDYDDPEFQRSVMNYLRNRGQVSRQESQPAPSRIKYTVNDQSSEDYIIYTNNLFEAKVKRTIVKKQDRFYPTFHRKLRQQQKRGQKKAFDDLALSLDIPAQNNQHSKAMEIMLPNKRRRIDELDSSIYNIVFNADGSQLLVTTKESLHLFEEKDGNYVAGKVLRPRNITWTITDSDLSPCGRYLIHCSLNSFVSIFDLQTGKYSNFYNFNDETGEEYVNDDYWERLRFFSCKYSGDGTKILASSGVSYNRQALIKVFDIGAERVCDSINAHDDDINSISFVNKLNSSVFISGSDDRLVKIWDTRALGSRGSSAGELIGHVAGITHVDSRQDNYYVASNGKDSCVKLWDLRKSESSSLNKPRKNMAFDYRGHALSDEKVQAIRGLSQTQNFDNSVQTYRGHKVGGTLMRCHFSPLGPTDRRYIYTASSCGRLFIYDILTGRSRSTDGELVGFEEEKTSYTAAVLNDLERSPIRDAIWHPQKMEIITTNLRGQLFKWHNTSLFQDSIKAKEINDEMSVEGGDDNSDADSVETIETGARSRRGQYPILFQADDFDDEDEFGVEEEEDGDDDDNEIEDKDDEEEEEEEEDDDEDYNQDDGEEEIDLADLDDMGSESLQNFIRNRLNGNNEENSASVEEDSESVPMHEESSNQVGSSEDRDRSNSEEES